MLNYSHFFIIIILLIILFYNFFVVDDEYQFLLGDNLNFESLILQRTRHEAYCSKPLERKIKKSSSSGSNSSNSIMPNRASNLVSFFSKNEDPHQRFVTQREKRWKENRNNVSLTLAQLHIEELDKLKNKQKSNKKRFQQSLIESKLLDYIYLLLISKRFNIK